MEGRTEKKLWALYLEFAHSSLWAAIKLIWSSQIYYSVVKPLFFSTSRDDEEHKPTVANVFFFKIYTFAQNIFNKISANVVKRLQW